MKNTPKPTPGELKIPAAVQLTTATITPPKNEARYALRNQPAYMQMRQGAIKPKLRRLTTKGPSAYAEYAAAPWTKELLKLRKSFI